MTAISVDSQDTRPPAPDPYPRWHMDEYSPDWGEEWFTFANTYPGYPDPATYPL